MTNPIPSTSTCPSTDTTTDEEWDEIRCPICMDHPHNAVQLRCSSVNCRCFICNTSYRHSNCLDRFERPSVQNNTDNNTEENLVHLKCPLCRGVVTGWSVNDEARQYMDKKSRDCSRDKCEFQGNYEELRRHARKSHPFNRPAEVDSSRQRQWRQIEQQQELGDVMSAIRSEIPDAVVVGDYAVEADEVSSLDDVTTVGNSDESRSFWTTLVLGPVVGSRNRSSREESRESPVESSTAHPSRRRRRRYLWGEILLGLQYDDGSSESRDDGDVYDDDRIDNTRILRRRLDGEGSTFASIRHVGGNENHDDNLIQREDVERIDAALDEYTDAENTDDGDADGDEYQDDDYVTDRDSDDGTDRPSRW